MLNKYFIFLLGTILSSQTFLAFADSEPFVYSRAQGSIRYDSDFDFYYKSRLEGSSVGALNGQPTPGAHLTLKHLFSLGYFITDLWKIKIHQPITTPIGYDNKSLQIQYEDPAIGIQRSGILRDIIPGFKMKTAIYYYLPISNKTKTERGTGMDQADGVFQLDNTMIQFFGELPFVFTSIQRYQRFLAKDPSHRGQNAGLEIRSRMYFFWNNKLSNYVGMNNYSNFFHDTFQSSVDNWEVGIQWNFTDETLLVAYLESTQWQRFSDSFLSLYFATRIF